MGKNISFLKTMFYFNSFDQKIAKYGFKILQKDQYNNLSNLKLVNNHDTEVATPILQYLKVAQLCLSLFDPMDYIVCGILQARTLKWAAFPFSRGSFQPRDQIQVFHIAGRFLTS